MLSIENWLQIDAAQYPISITVAVIVDAANGSGGIKGELRYTIDKHVERTQSFCGGSGSIHIDGNVKRIIATQCSYNLTKAYLLLHRHVLHR